MEQLQHELTQHRSAPTVAVVGSSSPSASSGPCTECAILRQQLVTALEKCKELELRVTPLQQFVDTSAASMAASSSLIAALTARAHALEAELAAVRVLHSAGPAPAPSAVAAVVVNPASSPASSPVVAASSSSSSSSAPSTSSTSAAVDDQRLQTALSDLQAALADVVIANQRADTALAQLDAANKELEVRRCPLASTVV